MEKGIFCLGCSFTWGEGLYFYSGLADDILKPYHSFDVSQMREVYHEYRKKYRWPRLLANSLNSWEFTSDIGNGGANISHYIYCAHNKLLSGEIKYSDFDYFIWQFTDPLRDFPGGYERLETMDGDQTFEIVKEECKRQLLFMDRVLKEWEQRGVKVLTYSWWPELIQHPYYKENFEHRHVQLYTEDETPHDSLATIIYRGEEKILKETDETVTIHVDDDFFSGLGLTPPPNSHLGSTNVTRKKYTIKDDFYLKGFQKNDIHLNKQGHELVANSILKKIQTIEQNLI